jgi:hypothetical protein
MVGREEKEGKGVQQKIGIEDLGRVGESTAEHRVEEKRKKGRYSR